MAFAEKYNLSFSDNRGTVWRLGIFKKDYAGSSSTIESTGEPLQINWKGDGLYTPLRGSEAIVNGLSTTDFQYSEFFTAAVDDYLLEVKKAGTVWWQGVMITDIYREPYVQPPYPITLKFSCGIGAMKFIEYKNGASFFTGKEKLIKILVNCFNLLPFQINTREIINILEDSTADNDANGLLSTTFLDRLTFRKFNTQTQLFEGQTCHEVITDIMQSIGCTMYQSENKWWVVRIEEYEKASPHAINYNTVGNHISNGSITVQQAITNTEAGITPIFQDQNLVMSEVFDELIYNYNYKPPDRNADELITDWNMEIGANAFNQGAFASTYPLWEKSAAILPATIPGTPEKFIMTNSLFPDLTLGLFFGAFFGFTNLLENTPVFNSNYWIKPLEVSGETITYRDLITTVNDTLRLGISGYYMLHLIQASKYSSVENIFYDMQVFISVQIGTFFLKEDLSDGSLSWTNTSTDKISFKLGRQIRNDDGNYASSPGGNPGGFTAYYVFNETIDTPTLPEDAENDLTITFYIPASPLLADGSTYSMLCEEFNMDTFTCKFQPDNKTMLNSIISLSNISGIRDRTKEVVVRFGDGIAKAVRSAFKLVTGELTSAWFFRGDIGTTFSAARIFILRSYVDYFSAYRQEINGTLYGDIEFSNSFLLDSKIFFADSLNYSIKSVKYKYNLIQLSTVNVLSVDKEFIGVSDIASQPVNPFPTHPEDLDTNLLEKTNTQFNNTEIMNMAMVGSEISKIEDTSSNSTNFRNYPV